MPVTAVAFDMGGVLTVPPFAGLEAYGREVGLPPGVLAALFRGEAMARLEIGAISSREFFKHVCVECETRHRVRIDIHALAEAGSRWQQLQPEMLVLVEDVSKRCTTALLTNNVKEATWRDAFPHHLFDVELDSSAVGLRKPDPAIYALLLERLGRPAEEVAFFDDTAEHLPAAAALGIHAIHFTGLETCRRALVDLGVLETVPR
jgi:epoxide hydrolase-like predicted phosphatase